MRKFQNRETKKTSGSSKREEQQEVAESSIIRRILICSPRQTTLGLSSQEG